MTDNNDPKEKRRAARADLVKLTFIKKDDVALGCLLHDISVTGASVDFIKLPGLDSNPFKIDDEVEIVVDDVGAAKGTVTRARANGAAIGFNELNDDELSFIKSLSVD